MDSFLFVKIADAVNEAENTELPGHTKRMIVQNEIQDILGVQYMRYEPMVGLAIDAIVDIRKSEMASHRRQPIMYVLPPPRSSWRSFIVTLCCL
jgi:hypothetical protein